MTVISREMFMAATIELLHRLIKKVEPGGDLPMLLVFTDGEGMPTPIKVTPVPMPMGVDKDDMAQQMRELLRDQHAVIYSIIAASWTIGVDLKDKPESEKQRILELAQQYGTGHPELRKHRKEMYAVTCCDHAGTDFASYTVTRNKKGKITKLTLWEETTGAELEGRFMGLLQPPRSIH